MKKNWIIHPIALAVFPILFLYTNNAGKFPPASMLVPMLITVSSAALLWVMLGLILRNWQKAGVIVSASLLLFFTYGRVWYLIWDVRVTVAGVTLGPNKLLFALWLGLFCLSGFLVVRAKKDLGSLTRFLNVASAVLILFSVVSLGVHALRAVPDLRDNTVEDYEGVQLSTEELAALPDIYYIILDAYARADVLADLYGYDNSEMLDYLDETGFYVASQSRANYAQTALSLASALNMEYVNYLSEQVGQGSDNRRPLRDMIRNSKVASVLKRHSYTLVAFSTGYAMTEMTNADVYMRPVVALSEFENGLLNTTPIPAVLGILSIDYQYDLHRGRILYTLEHLADAAKMEGPAFVFAHILAPHPPFVFGRNGEEVRSEGGFTLEDGWVSRYKQGYSEQLEFINGRLRHAINDILGNSRRPVVILLQADHGPGMTLDWEDPEFGYLNERMPILNAYLLPEGGSDGLYEEISPVNTFRVVLDRYFGLSYDLLEDESYTSSWEQPYQFLNVDAIDAQASD